MTLYTKVCLSYTHIAYQEKDFARINAKKQEFRNLSSPGLNSKRYHKDSDGDQKFAELKPGVVRWEKLHYAVTKTEILAKRIIFS